MGHVVLVGDSVFDNARYVPGAPSVIEHLRRLLPAGWRATLLARDGAAASDVSKQLQGLPEDASHLIVSAGGNNALDSCGYIRNGHANAVSEVLEELEAIQTSFRREYRDMLSSLGACDRPTALCTIYDSIPELSRADCAGLSVFNDVILREAARLGIPVIDLRLICNEATDYSASSPIEPSASGGGKIARAINRVLATHDFGEVGSRVYGP